MNQAEVREGYWPNGQLQFQYTLQNGLQHGLSQKWHENGLLYEILNFRNGTPYGDFLRFHPDGTIAGRGFMIGDNKYDGIHDVYAVNHWNGAPYAVRQIFQNGVQVEIFSVNLG
jgi:antitoxin component YwqK of YwqJK toxin-antitoxin module